MRSEALLHAEVRRFTVDEVLHMVDAGILPEDEPVELLEGRLVVMSPQGRPHAYVVSLLAQLLRDVVGPGSVVYEEKPLLVDDTTAPEPDVMVVRGGRRAHLERGIAPSDVVLVCEVASSSLLIDRDKAELYARAGVPMYWLVDLDHRRVEVRESPRTDGSYERIRIEPSTASLVVPGTGHSLAIQDLLP